MFKYYYCLVSLIQNIFISFPDLFINTKIYNDYKKLKFNLNEFITDDVVDNNLNQQNKLNGTNNNDNTNNNHIDKNQHTLNHTDKHSSSNGVLIKKESILNQYMLILYKNFNSNLLLSIENGINYRIKSFTPIQTQQLLNQNILNEINTINLVINKNLNIYNKDILLWILKEFKIWKINWYCNILLNDDIDKIIKKNKLENLFFNFLDNEFGKLNLDPERI